MDETGQFVSYAAFFVAAVLSTIAQARFFKALERQSPGVAAPDDEVIEHFSAKPSAFASIMVRATGRRLSALARRWPGPGRGAQEEVGARIDRAPLRRFRLDDREGGYLSPKGH